MSARRIFFSIEWTISQLMADTVGTFQIRMYQATDVTEVFLDSGNIELIVY